MTMWDLQREIGSRITVNEYIALVLLMIIIFLILESNNWRHK